MCDALRKKEIWEWFGAEIQFAQTGDEADIWEINSQQVAYMEYLSSSSRQCKQTPYSVPPFLHFLFFQFLNDRKKDVLPTAVDSTLSVKVELDLVFVTLQYAQLHQLVFNSLALSSTVPKLCFERAHCSLTQHFSTSVLFEYVYWLCYTTRDWRTFRNEKSPYCTFTIKTQASTWFWRVLNNQSQKTFIICLTLDL